MRFAVHDKATGEILRQGTVSEPTPDDPAPHLRQLRYDGEAVVILAKGVPVDDRLHRIDVATGAVIAKPAPSPESLAAGAMAALRRRRDALLAAADWSQFAHVPMTSAARAAWAAYMQALRDLPATTQDPANPAWPAAPKKD